MSQLVWNSPGKSYLGTGPIWMFRLFPVLTMVLLALARLVFPPSTHAKAHGFCLGAALGVMISFSLVCFQVKSVDLKDSPQPSDVEHLSIT